MRLLHTTHLEFQEFFDDVIPDYSILSHRWEGQEVSHQDFIAGTNKLGKGYEKIRGACEAAKSRNLDWIWIDTCCIDSKSSAELSEAINSMFAWYRNARECYAYLSDVISFTTSEHIPETAFRKSEWFTRGWTLQELIAPRHVLFFDRDWKFIGTKDTLRARLHKFSGIPRAVLLGSNLSDYSVAAKMSWASKRKTTRVEDIAYCLLGIFDVNMPLMYGEGVKAFRRLQEEIVKSYADETIFCWERTHWGFQFCLAPSPSQFENSGRIRNKAYFSRAPYLVTHKGLQMEARTFSEKPDTTAYHGSLCIPLNATREGRAPMALIVTKREISERISCIDLGDETEGSLYHNFFNITTSESSFDEVKNTSLWNSLGQSGQMRTIYIALSAAQVNKWLLT